LKQRLVAAWITACSPLVVVSIPRMVARAVMVAGIAVRMQTAVTVIRRAVNMAVVVMIVMNRAVSLCMTVRTMGLVRMIHLMIIPNAPWAV